MSGAVEVHVEQGLDLSDEIIDCSGEWTVTVVRIRVVARPHAFHVDSIDGSRVSSEHVLAGWMDTPEPMRLACGWSTMMVR